MSRQKQSLLSAAVLAQLQNRFLSILPRIKLHARIYFRQIKCAFKKADFIAEVVAVAWKWFLRLAEKGKDACHFVSVLATYAAKAVKCGRRVYRMNKAKDAMNEQTQQRHNFCVSKLPDYSTLSDNPLQEALTDTRHWPPQMQLLFVWIIHGGGAATAGVIEGSSTTCPRVNARWTCRNGTRSRPPASASFAASSTMTGFTSTAR